jgi:hypothetical protein
MHCKNKILNHFQTLVAMIQNIFHHTIQFLKAIMGQNMSIMPFLIIVNPWKFNINFFAPIHHNKMALLNASTTILPQ